MRQINHVVNFLRKNSGVLSLLAVFIISTISIVLAFGMSHVFKTLAVIMFFVVATAIAVEMRDVSPLVISGILTAIACVLVLCGAIILIKIVTGG